jgi:hypothetical protein
MSSPLPILPSSTMRRQFMSIRSIWISLMASRMDRVFRCEWSTIRGSVLMHKPTVDSRLSMGRLRPDTIVPPASPLRQRRTPLGLLYTRYDTGSSRLTEPIRPVCEKVERPVSPRLSQLTSNAPTTRHRFVERHLDRSRDHQVIEPIIACLYITAQADSPP